MKGVSASPKHAQHGLTLVELMVSLTIGLVIILATISSYLGSQSASKLSEAQSRMNEDGQAALAILTQQLRMVGDNPQQPNRPAECARNPVYSPSIYPRLSCTAPALFTSALILGTQTFMIRGCEGAFSDVSTATSVAALTCTAGATDAIAITYEASNYNTIPTGTKALGTPTDCLGQNLSAQVANVPAAASAVPLAATYYMADNRFFVGAPSGSTVPSLYCKGNGGVSGSAAQPLVENIEDLQFSYGVAPATGVLTVAGYLDGAALLTQTDLAALPGDAERWARVLTIRVCVQVRSDTEVLDTLAAARYRRCDGTLVTSPVDRRLHRTYENTVVLRNRLANLL